MLCLVLKTPEKQLLVVRSAPRRQHGSNRQLKWESGLCPLLCQLQKETGREPSTSLSHLTHKTLYAQVAHLDTSSPHLFPSPPQLGPHVAKLQCNTELSLFAAWPASDMWKGFFKADVGLIPDTSSQLGPKLTGPWYARGQAAALHDKPSRAMLSTAWWTAASCGPEQTVSWAGRADAGDVCLLGHDDLTHSVISAFAT